MKSFKMGNLTSTDAEGSPPPPPAPSDPAVEAANAAAAAAAAAAANLEGPTYATGSQADMYPSYTSYMMNRYTDPSSRYSPYSGTSGTPAGSTTSYIPVTSSHISAHTATSADPTSVASAYTTYGVRYPDYNRYPYSGGPNPTSPTSPRWRRRSYDPEYLSRRNAAAAAAASSRPLGDLASSAAGVGPTSSVLMRSRSRSRVSTEYDPNAYLRYMSPSSASSTSAYSTRPMSSYMYGHSAYSPAASATSSGSTLSSYHGGGGGLDSGVGSSGRLGSAPPGGPQPPPNYNAMDREVSARVRRYQQQTDPAS